MLTIELNDNKEKLVRQKEALEWQLTQDTDDYSIHVHLWALQQINNKLSGEQCHTTNEFMNDLALEQQENCG